MNNPEYVKVNDKKYKINTDYRVGLRCQEVANDTSIGDYERALAIIYLLFGDDGLNNTRDYEKLIELGLKYLSCNEKVEDNSNEEKDMDLLQDFRLIQASFKSDYGIELDKENIHWWDFMGYLNGLTENCVLNRIRELRTYDLSTIEDGKQRAKVQKMKKRWELKKPKKELTEEQKRSVDYFYKQTGIKREE